MNVSFQPVPAFGQSDLSNCEREQIHLAASIQPQGVLVVAREPDLLIVQASTNAPVLLGLDGAVLGRSLDALGGNLAERIRPHLNDPLISIPLALRCRVGCGAREFDVLLHRPPAGGLIVELEPAGPPVDFSHAVHRALQSIIAAASLRTLCDETARLFKTIAGYDRVMVYRFDTDEHGEVLAEAREPELEPYLGNRYPDSDIPRIARRLYERNRVRVLVDVDDTPVPLAPRLSPLTGEDLDLSLCTLRSMSPVHLQYLRNMGVRATLVASLLVGGRLWGLVACHHCTPRAVRYEVRAVCELLAEAVATRIAALESFVQAQAELSVRRLEQRMIEAISREGDWTSALFDHPQSLLQPCEARGAALLYDGRIHTAGEVPGTQDLRDLRDWLDARSPASDSVIATAALGRDDPRFARLKAVASGILAAPLSNCPGEYLIWFRPERIRTVTWGGNPFKPVLPGADPMTLSPRRSFSQWHQVVEGNSTPWTPANLATARLIGESVADVIQQFRSVRVLIAQAQLAQVRSQVRISEQPIIITDSDGLILLTTQSLEHMLGAEERRPQHLDHLLALISQPSDVAQRLSELLRDYRPWRGEICLDCPIAGRKPFLMRADPVFSSPGRVLGFVFLLTDLSTRKAAEEARQRFQEGILEQQKIMRLPLHLSADPMYRDLLSAIVGNAQLAALEVADGVELARVPAMVDGVQTSVSRAAELLEHLVWYAAQESRGRVKQ